MQEIQKARLPQLWEYLAKKAPLYLPQQEDGVINFAPWQEGARVKLESLNTVLPPKSIVFPQWETYLHFTQKARELKLTPTKEPEGSYILFGVRPCDVAGITVLDRVFLQDPVDVFYESRRRCTIISLACNEPDISCFCSAFGLEPGFAPAADIMLWDGDKFLLWQSLTEKGETLTHSLTDLLEVPTPAETESVQCLRETAATVQEQKWGLDGVKERAKDMFNAPIWDSLYRRCLGCGICTYLCPTCHCFDIGDFSRGERGERFRCWDSCMYKDFTLMASGENPRPTQKERVRQRFMHKLSYFPAQHGLYGCVGCGRCVRKCPVNIDITQVIKEAGGSISCA
ncbi:MAG: 4Fe-4S dicluster domain-containing protein [Bacillota bacterium]